MLIYFSDFVFCLWRVGCCLLAWKIILPDRGGRANRLIYKGVHGSGELLWVVAASEAVAYCGNEIFTDHIQVAIAL
ncbi:hypothetical protein [Burkholderia pseudomallei]|uniref:hypothetical protein n=1 Tax=Burkholderia pseudomallei TaxID=28450 RepID=UPI0012FDA119|nr:hypothetical protein [Burkholderia pseudomallei]